MQINLIHNQKIYIYQRLFEDVKYIFALISFFAVEKEDLGFNFPPPRFGFCLSLLWVTLSLRSESIKFGFGFFLWAFGFFFWVFEFVRSFWFC